jgi:hypothetical protein
MQNVTVIKSHSYAARWRPSGSRYPAEDRDIPILRRMGYVELDAKVVVKKPMSRPEAPPPPREAPPVGKRIVSNRGGKRGARAKE